MKHLKLGTYSFVIDVDKLGLSSGTAKGFTRDELPDELKSLFDIVQSDKVCEKSVFVDIQTENYTKGGGYLVQTTQISYQLTSSDGVILYIAYENSKLVFTYTER